VSETLKIIVPMAGLGTRLRPLTLTRPKPLLSLAGKTVLDFFLDTFTSIPLTRQMEFVFIVGQMGEQIKDYIDSNYPQIPAHYVTQSEMRGQSDAIFLAREYLTGPAIVAFSDTLADTDFTALANESADAMLWVKPVEDPRRFGVAEVNASGYVKRLIEKPEDMTNNLAIVGIYYFKDSAKLCDAITEQIKRKRSLKGEYYLADAVNILLEQGIKIRAIPIEVWLDAGTPDAMLTTNRYLLENGNDNSNDIPKRTDVAIIPPVFLHPDATISNSVVGPNVSISAGCKINASVLSNAIIGDGTEINNLVIDNSILGRNARVTANPVHLNFGDQNELEL
jgi:glucose-1-phosphate thymidylyltransferase